MGCWYSGIVFKEGLGWDAMMQCCSLILLGNGGQAGKVLYGMAATEKPRLRPASCAATFTLSTIPAGRELLNVQCSVYLRSTREEVDRAHSEGVRLDIGVDSSRYLR